MSRMVLDAAVAGKLGKVHCPTMLYDQNGNVLGMLIPEGELNPAPVLSNEEIERRINSKKYYTTAEVLKYLESLP